MLDISTLKYRTARDFRVVPYNRIETLLGSSIDTGSDFISEGYGFLTQKSTPNDQAAQRVSEIDKETALLLFTLQEPGVLPDYLLNEYSAEAEKGVLNLLYAGLIEAEVDGKFVSGSKVIDYINAQKDDVQGIETALISHNALKRADQLGLIYEDQIFNYLYQYHAIPSSPLRRDQLQNDRQFLKLSELNSVWQYSDKMEGWHYFSDSRSSSKPYIAKLYISPCVDDLPDVLRKTSQVLAAYPGVSFKVGSGYTGVLRPDKLVVYFDSIDNLLEAADMLANTLHDVKAHGVPFTSRISCDGLISWGMDPKESNGERKSWRQWIIEKLAGYMLRDDRAHIEPDRWKLALAQLELEGVNSNTFRPGGSWITEYS